MDETTARRHVRMLAVRLPYWVVWYGEHTGRFWAVPRVRHLGAVTHLESPTAEDLECRAREAERALGAR
ncbi:hypothetical protein [Streptosporangium sp. KLBMP 9127]|nr:hypothetical protein [Streptosporangium sp. KLBMP 9127]